MKSRDLVNTGESAVAIFTRGGRFVLRDYEHRDDGRPDETPEAENDLEGEDDETEDYDTEDDEMTTNDEDDTLDVLIIEDII